MLILQCLESSMFEAIAHAMMNREADRGGDDKLDKDANAFNEKRGLRGLGRQLT